MDIDIDWCLTCEKRVEGSSLYCSPDCQDRAGPSTTPLYYYQQSTSSILDDEDDVIFHPIDDATPTPQHSRWTGNDSAGISAWAADIPSGAPAGGISSPCDDSSSFYSLSGGTYRQPPPNLLKTPTRRLVPPTLSVTTPPSVLPPLSTPMVTPKRQPSMTSAAQTGNASTGQTSLRSAATESSLVATPASSQPVPIGAASRRPSIIDDMYCHVRSWVSPSPATKPVPQTPARRVDLPKFTLPPPTPTFPVVKVVSSPQSLRGFSEQSAVCWMAGHVLVEQPPTKRPNIYEPSRGRKLAAELPFRHDDHPSFRTRGRKASRAAA